MKKLKIKLEQEELKNLTKKELVKKINSGYGCPQGYYWDEKKQECILDS